MQKEESRHSFHLLIVPAERVKQHTFKTLSITNAGETEKADVSGKGSLDFFGMFYLNELSAETIAIFFFVSLWRRESSHRTRFRIDIYDIKRDKKKEK